MLNRHPVTLRCEPGSHIKTRINALVRASLEGRRPPTSGLPEIGNHLCASRLQPTCVPSILRGPRKEERGHLRMTELGMYKPLTVTLRRPRATQLESPLAAECAGLEGRRAMNQSQP